ncbi:MAG TPA: HEAT repeat domain-containing protein [bacterium]|nr:HEAT repeat domain-containing protein [bacterium]
MRLTTLVAVLLLTGLVLFLAGWFRPHSKPAAAAPSPSSSVPLEEAASIQVAAPQLQTVAPSTLPPVAAAATPDAQTIENRIAELETLALNDDTNSLQLILVALSDANPEIRGAALESTIQFGSPDAIPALQSVLAKTELAEEKVKIQEAIEFLKLPPLVTTVPSMP